MNWRNNVKENGLFFAVKALPVNGFRTPKKNKKRVFKK